MGVYPVGIVGESHYQPAVRSLRVGQRIDLVHEPDNPHDDRAVAALTTGGRKIGHIARGHWLQEMIAERGQPVSATVLEITGAGQSSRGVVLEVATGGDVAGRQATAPERGGGCAFTFALMTALPLAALATTLVACDAAPGASTSAAPTFRAIGRDQFVMVFDPSAPRAEVESVARAKCAGLQWCKVMGWSDPQRAATALPMTDREVEAQRFAYTLNRASGADDAAWLQD